MFIFDRLYGQIKFPSLIKEVLNCPGLLRLREVRFANIPLFSFPSLDSITRYEHSLGVCHLAGVFADNIGLPEKDKIEIMLAALYHDVATPPFSHAVEEVLKSLFGFDHEQKLKDLIIGKSKQLGGQRAQIFLGRSLKLHSVCQGKLGRKLGIDLMRIADLAVGSDQDPLGDLICSNGIDLDNIDNVARSALAMGITDCEPHFAEFLTKSLVLYGDKISIDPKASYYFKKWQKLRATLYGMIYASIIDFAVETMIKDAVRRLLFADSENKLSENDWSLTDDQLIHGRLMKYNDSAEIIKKVRLGRLYNCLALLSIEGDDIVRNLSSYLQEIEGLASEVYNESLSNRFGKELTKLNTHDLIANYYIDKRERNIGRQLYLLDNNQYKDKRSLTRRAILGIFTSHHRKWETIALGTFINRLAAECLVGAKIRRIKVRYGKYPNIETVEIP